MEADALVILGSLQFLDLAWVFPIWMSFWGCGWLGHDLEIAPSSVGALGGCLGGKSLAGLRRFQDLVCWLFRNSIIINIILQVQSVA